VRKIETLVAVLLVVTMLSGIGFAAVYALGAQIQLAAAMLVFGFGSLAAAMVVWERRLMPTRVSVEDRGSLPSGDEKDDAAADTLLAGAGAIVGRRTWLVRLFGSALAALGAGALFPLRSLAPRLTGIDELNHTSWKPGIRLVGEDGTLVHASDLENDSMLTVFPEGHVGPQFIDEMANDATVLVRVPPAELELPPARATWGPEGLLAFSKVCTHAGCPVALYRAKARQLFCPCHQSTFDVRTGGARIFGPAARGLPQLPIAIAHDGTLHALGDFPEPIGPGYWERA